MPGSPDPLGRKPRSVARRHQLRACSLLRAVQHEQLDTEVAIPESSRFLDGLITIRAASDCWGPIRSDLEGRQLLFEHFSRAPSPRDLAVVVMKLGFLTDRWFSTSSSPPRPPLALVLSVGRPRGALVHFGFRERALPALWDACMGALGILLVDARNLPVAPGTSFLRAFDHRGPVQTANLRHLYDDPEIDWATKLEIGAAIMAEPNLWAPAARQLTAKQLFARGEAEGRRAALRLLLGGREGVLTRPLEDALDGCDDLARLDRALALLNERLGPKDLATRLHAALGDEA